MMRTNAVQVRSTNNKTYQEHVHAIFGDTKPKSAQSTCETTQTDGYLDVGIALIRII